MCVAIPGRVISVSDGRAVIDFDGNETVARSGLVEVKPGDRVLVHAGLVIQKLKDVEADEMIRMFKEMEEESK